MMARQKRRKARGRYFMSGRQMREEKFGLAVMNAVVKRGGHDGDKVHTFACGCGCGPTHCFVPLEPKDKQWPDPPCGIRKRTWKDVDEFKKGKT